MERKSARVEIRSARKAPRVEGCVAHGTARKALGRTAQLPRMWWWRRDHRRDHKCDPLGDLRARRCLIFRPWRDLWLCDRHRTPHLGHAPFPIPCFLAYFASLQSHVMPSSSPPRRRGMDPLIAHPPLLCCLASLPAGTHRMGTRDHLSPNEEIRLPVAAIGFKFCSCEIHNGTE